MEEERDIPGVPSPESGAGQKRGHSGAESPGQLVRRTFRSPELTSHLPQLENPSLLERTARARTNSHGPACLIKMEASLTIVKISVFL